METKCDFSLKMVKNVNSTFREAEVEAVSVAIRAVRAENQVAVRIGKTVVPDLGQEAQVRTLGCEMIECVHVHT